MAIDDVEPVQFGEFGIRAKHDDDGVVSIHGAARRAAGQATCQRREQGKEAVSPAPSQSGTT